MRKPKTRSSPRSAATSKSWRTTPGASSSTWSARKTTTCRPTTCSSSRSRPSRTAPRRPTSACTCWPPAVRASSDGSTQKPCWRASRPRSTPSTACTSTTATCSTGTTRRRSSRCRPTMCPAWTAATSRATSWPWRRPAAPSRRTQAASPTKPPHWKHWPDAAARCTTAWISAASTTPSATCSTSACASKRTCSTRATTTCWPPSRAC
ncbi:hypothetical protein D9M68_486990 [compost metagenome]